MRISDWSSDVCSSDLILNGTCNYILTLMERDGASFADALAAAQAEGYAEADPSFDVDGIDAAHKLSILAALCFGTRLDIDAVAATGIRNIIAADIREAEALGHRVRLPGMAERDAGGLYQKVQPCLEIGRAACREKCVSSCRARWA